MCPEQTHLFHFTALEVTCFGYFFEQLCELFGFGVGLTKRSHLEQQYTSYMYKSLIKAIKIPHVCVVK